jgi:hypothetical protein
MHLHRGRGHRLCPLLVRLTDSSQFGKHRSRTFDPSRPLGRLPDLSRRRIAGFQLSTEEMGESLEDAERQRAAGKNVGLN